jgi:hypothetical protein
LILQCDLLACLCPRLPTTKHKLRIFPPNDQYTTCTDCTVIVVVSTSQATNACFRGTAGEEMKSTDCSRDESAQTQTALSINTSSRSNENTISHLITPLRALKCCDQCAVERALTERHTVCTIDARTTPVPTLRPRVQRIRGVSSSDNNWTRSG